MASPELLERLKQFAYRVVKPTKSLPENSESRIIKNQILRSAFSAAGHYRSACKAYTKKLFSSKMGIAFEEMDEPLFGLAVISDLSFITKGKLTLLMKEGEELCTILAKSIITSRVKNKI